MSVVHKHTSLNKVFVDQQSYLSKMGALNYLAQFTAPQLLYSLSAVAQKCAKPTKMDEYNVDRIFRYLRDSVHDGIAFFPGDIQLMGYVDSAHNCYPDGRAHYGYTFSLGPDDGSFFAVSRKMKLCTLSSLN